MAAAVFEISSILFWMRVSIDFFEDVIRFTTTSITDTMIAKVAVRPNSFLIIANSLCMAFFIL